MPGLAEHVVDEDGLGSRLRVDCKVAILADGRAKPSSFGLLQMTTIDEFATIFDFELLESMKYQAKLAQLSNF